MNKKERILKNLRLIIITSLVSVVSVLLIFPPILNLQFIKNFLKSTSIKLFTGITAIILIVLIWTWEKANKLWQRYKNTKRTKKFPLNYVDIIGLYLLITVCMGVAFLSVATSKEFRCFLILNFVFFLIWLVSGFYWKVITAKKKDLKGMDSLSDEPITTHEEDILRREKFIKDLCRVIEGLPTNVKSSSYTLGLHGRWGEGKTSVINLLVDKLKGNDQFLIIRFEPWHFKDGEAILKSFYTQIEKEILDKYIFPAFKRTISRYQKAISTGISLPGFNLALNPPDESMDDLKEKIESYINQIRKKLLIIIDDIDRLQPEEISLIFKLVRKNTNFKNTIFLLSFDQEIVKNGLKANCDIDPDFLEKIVQKPISLPAIEHNSIADLLYSEIGKLLKSISIEDTEIDIGQFLQEFSSHFEPELRILFKTLRQVKRYINSLKATLPAVKHEVFLNDFFILECIRVFNIELYRDIWAHPWYYIGETLDTTFTTPLSDKKEENKKIIKGHIDSVLSSSPQGSVFIELLASLFPEYIGGALDARLNYLDYNRNYSNSRIYKRISNHECFAKYFILQIPQSEISDEYIERMIKFWNSKEVDAQKGLIKNEIFKDTDSNRRIELLQKMSEFSIKMTPKLAQSVIEAIYLNADKFSKENGFDSEYSNAKKLMLWLINDKIAKGKIQSIIEDAVLNTPDIHFSVMVVNSCRKELRGQIHNIFESIDIEYLKGKVSERLEEYFIREERNIFECFAEDDWPFLLYQWASNWGADGGKNKETVSKYVLSLVKDDGKRFSKLLDKIINRDIDSTEISNFERYKKIYNYQEFEKIANKFKGDKQLSDEERSTIKVFLEQIQKTPNLKKKIL